uniref:Unannotated protein n=1 Tax=freshwater metagenome TaxID=449393 RepID=A0A6J5YYW7_9ZZZZ
MAEPTEPLRWQDGWTLVLASGSPQRSEILRSCGLKVDVRPTGADELDQGEPHVVAAANARAKAQAGRAGLTAAERERSVVLGADTLVALDGKIYGKPADEQQARDYLTELARAPHEVVGAITVIDPFGNAFEAVVTTMVEFRPLTPDEIAEQVALGEWEGRAGGYAIQLSGDRMVADIGEDRLNVVGLSLTALNGLVQGLLPAGSDGFERYTS